MSVYDSATYALVSDQEEEEGEEDEEEEESVNEAMGGDNLDIQEKKKRSR